MEKQNITLSIRKDILRKIKIMAAKQNSSVSAILTNQLEEIISRAEGFQSAKTEHLRLLQQETKLGTRGIIDRSRDDLHER
jgi:hypothetical protein